MSSLKRITESSLVVAHSRQARNIHYIIGKKQRFTKDAKNSKYIFCTLMLPVHKIPFTLIPSTRFSSWKPPSLSGFSTIIHRHQDPVSPLFHQKSKILTVFSIPTYRSHRYWEKVIFMTLNYLMLYCELPFSELFILAIFVSVYIHTHIYIHTCTYICI